MMRLECPQCGGEIGFRIFLDGDGDGAYARSFWSWEPVDGCDCTLTTEQDAAIAAVIEDRIEKGDIGGYFDD